MSTSLAPNRITTVVHVFGANYQVPAITQAIGIAPARAGVITEIGHETTTWSTVTSTRGLSRMFIWATGTTAAKVHLTADHSTLTTDSNDMAYVKAVIADAPEDLVTAASNPVTFSVTGPRTIVAVDSGTLVGEPFRGNLRNVFEGEFASRSSRRMALGPSR